MSIRFLAVSLPSFAGLALAACAVGPTYTAPAPAAPANWQAALPHGGNIGAMRDWWGQFDDPVVAQLISLAEAGSPSLEKAWASIEKSRATLTTARAAGLPSVDGSASVTRARQETIPNVLTTSTTRSAGLDASWEIDIFGKVRRSTEAAEARATARVADWHNARLSLAAEVADTYVQYRACQLLADAYERERISTADTEKATALSVRAGFDAPSDGDLALASLASASSTQLSQRAQCDLLVKSLVELTGHDETSLRSLLSTSRPLRGIPEPADLEVRSVPADVLRQRPDLASLERELAATSAEIGVAQADLYPSLSLSGSISLSAMTAVPTLTTWSFGPSLSIPLFDAGKRHAAVDTARANYQADLADFHSGVRSAVKEVEQALVNLDGAARRAEQTERAAGAYQRYFLATEANWRAGGESLLTLEEARRSALSAEISVITLRRDRVEYWIALYKALGGGWQPGTPAFPPEPPTDASKRNS